MLIIVILKFYLKVKFLIKLIIYINFLFENNINFAFL